MCLDVEGVVEFKTVESKDYPDEVAESLSAYSRGRQVMVIKINADKHQCPRCVVEIVVNKLRSVGRWLLETMGCPGLAC